MVEEDYEHESIDRRIKVSGHMNSLSGFDLVGKRTDDGKIALGPKGNGEVFEDWPEKAVVNGRTYNLELVKIGENLEWGCYL